MNNELVYDWEDAVNFILERCDISRNVIETVLSLEEEYMVSVGIIDENEYYNNNDDDIDEDNFSEEEEFLDDDDDNEESEGFQCNLDIDCEECGYYIDNEGMCPYKMGSFYK